MNEKNKYPHKDENSLLRHLPVEFYELLNAAEIPFTEKKENKRPPHEEELTEREINVLKLAARGKTNEEVADKLCLSIKQVEKEIEDILLKFDVHNMKHAINEGWERGILTRGNH